MARSSTNAPRRATLAALSAAAIVICGLAVAQIAATAPTGERFVRAVIEGLIVGLPLGTGIYALRSPRSRWFGVLLIGSGCIWSLTALGEATESVAYSAGRVSAWLVFPLMLYLILAFPDGRLGSGARRLHAAVTVLIAVLFIGSALFVEAYPEHTPWASCTTDCPANAFLVLDSEPAVMADVVTPLRELISLILLAGIIVSVVRRYRGAPRMQRHVTAPVVVMSIVFSVLLVVYLVVRRIDADGAAVEPLGWVWSLTIPGVAVAFLIALVRARIAVADVLAALSVALTQRLDGAGLRSALGRLLGNPGLEFPIDDGDALVAALVHDGGVPDDDELLTAVRALVRATVQHERVMTELDVSRKRIARAADVERSRIERDLHDGAQQRLIGLRIKLSLAEELARTDPAAGVAAFQELGDDVEVTIEELRALAHGVYPSLLGDRGIADALRSVLAGAPLPVHFVTHELTRHGPELETAVYFTCLEAAQNAIKHADGATGLWVTLHEDDTLRFEVRDDGCGFEPPAGDVNGGLRNMRDRVEAMGGRLTIDSAPGQGTRIRGAVPLA